MNPRRAISEAFEQIATHANFSDIIRDLATMDHPTIRKIFTYMFDPNIKFDLDEGRPAFKTDQFDSYGQLWAKFRLMDNFIEGANNLPRKRKMILFIQLLESVHPKDAELLLAIKDKKTLWPFKINRKTVSKAYPGIQGVSMKSADKEESTVEE